MMVSIREQLRSGHYEGSMLRSNVEDISKQTRGRETEPTARVGAGRINLVMLLPTWRQG